MVGVLAALGLIRRPLASDLEALPCELAVTIAPVPETLDSFEVIHADQIVVTALYAAKYLVSRGIVYQNDVRGSRWVTGPRRLKIAGPERGHDVLVLVADRARTREYLGVRLYLHDHAVVVACVEAYEQLRLLIEYVPVPAFGFFDLRVVSLAEGHGEQVLEVESRVFGERDRVPLADVHDLSELTHPVSQNDILTVPEEVGRQGLDEVLA